MNNKTNQPNQVQVWGTNDQIWAGGGGDKDIC